MKVLPDELSRKPGLRQRFEREARAIASLNQPHICALYDVGLQDGVDFLVMEYLEGETLADRLSHGALKTMGVAIRAGGDSTPLEASMPQSLFRTPILNFQPSHYFVYDVTADGRRFLINTVPGGRGQTAINVVVNWQAGLK